MELYGIKQYGSFLATLDAEIKQRQKLIEDVKALFPNSAPASRNKTAKAVTRKRRTLSKAARARIAEAQRKRWAAQKKAAK